MENKIENGKPLTPEQSSKIEKYQSISIKLKELKNIIKGNKKNDDIKTNIYEYILYPELISLNDIKNKIFSIFDVKNNDEIFTFLLEEINSLFNKDKQIKNNLEEISIRGHFYKILENLNCYISFSLIYFQNNTQYWNKSFEYFNNWIINDNNLTRTIIYSYINIFNLYDLLFDYYGLKRNIFISINDINRILSLISILKMQNIFSFKMIIKTKSKILANHSIYVYELYRTYNLSIKEIYDLTDYLISLKTNWIEPIIIEKILNDIEVKDKLDDKVRGSLIEKLMVNCSLINQNEKIKEKDFISYYRIISKYLNIISHNYYINWKGLNALFESFINNKEYDKSINFLNSLQNINIINKYIDKKLIDKLVTSIPMGKIISISNIIKTNKELINYLLDNNRTKEGIKLIKALKLERKEYDKIFDEICMNNFFIYKINTCIDDSFDILLDYGLIDEFAYNKLLSKLMKKSYATDNSSYNNNTIQLKEEDEESYDNAHKIDRFDFLNSFFLRETIKRIKNEKNEGIKDNDLSSIDKEKILSIIHFGKKKNYNLTKNNRSLYDKIFGYKSFRNYNLNYNKYIPEDKYEPHDSTCISINTKEQKIVFIDNAKAFSNNYKFFKKSKFIGIDSEWRTSFYADGKEKASILQLSNFSEKNIMIIDLLKMENDKELMELFINSFKDKAFIGYAFNKSDIEQFCERLQNMFKECTIIDLIDIYQHKFLEKAPCLKELCQKFLGNKLCKYEQCSNWENRPLKKRQLHYAALDAIVCISLYKKMTDFV